MPQDQDATQPTPKTPAKQKKAQPRKRFQLEKLEERIAPAAHYNPQSKLVGTGNGNGGGSYGTIY